MVHHGWTATSVLSHLVLAVEEAIAPNRIVVVEEDGTLYGPVLGLQIVSLADDVLSRGSHLHTCWIEHWRSLDRREALKGLIEGAELIARRLNTWQVIEGGNVRPGARSIPAIGLPPLLLPSMRSSS